MTRLYFSSLRSRAITLVLLAILPLLAWTLYTYFAERHQAIHEVQRDELVAARNLAVLQESLIGSTRQLLMALARMPKVKGRRSDNCAALFADLMKQNPCYAVLGMADAEGWSIASAPQAPQRLNFSQRLWFQKVVQTRDFFVGEPLLCAISRQYVIVMSDPILDDQGQFQGVIYAGLDLNRLASLLARSDFPPGTALGLLDSNGKMLFRYPDPPKFVGQLGPDNLLRAMAVRNEGVAQGKGLPGDERLFAFARLSPPWGHLRVAIGLPREWAVAKVDRNLWRNLFWLALVAFLALAAARFGGNAFILQPVARLLEVTRRLTEGDLTARTGSPYTSGELGQLGQAFDRMADSLQEDEAELKRRLRELDQRSRELAAANKELEDFTYTVAHDLRAPLRAMGGFARVLLEDYPGRLDADGERYLHIINQEAKKMGQLIDALLALARLGRKEMNLATIDMDELVKAMVAESRAAHPDRILQIDVQPLPVVCGDRLMMRQLLANLLENAIKFTQEREPALIEVSGWSEGEEVVFCIKDNGVGFDMKYVDKLFEVFQQIHVDGGGEGTGVGLAIVKRVVDRHGGRVWAEGKVDEGARFCFAFPKRNSS